MAEEFHDNWEVVPFDLNKKPKEDLDAYALVPANTERQLAAMSSRQRSSTQSYHAQLVLIAPPQPLLLKEPLAKKEATVKVPAGTRILPPRPNERVVGVKTNGSGEISSIRYTTEEERPYFEGIRAAKVCFISPKAAPKHALNALETPPKRRKTIADIDEDIRRLDKVIIELQSSVNSITRQLSNQNTVILGLRHDLASANKKIRELERR
jgi:hypothetical protein